MFDNKTVQIAGAALCVVACIAFAVAYEWVGGDGDYDDGAHWDPQTGSCSPDCFPSSSSDDAKINGKDSGQRVVQLVKVGGVNVTIDDLALRDNVTFQDRDGNDPTLNTESIVITGRASGADTLIILEEGVTLTADSGCP